MASYVFEVECEIEATFSPAEPDVGIFGPCLDDLDLSSVSMLVRELNRNKFGMMGAAYKNIDLLDGLDKSAREQVIKNIFAAFGKDIEEAAWGDAE